MGVDRPLVVFDAGLGESSIDFRELPADADEATRTLEAVIGACYLAFGYEPTAEAVVDAFAPEIDDALENPVDYKSALQERLARRGALVTYEVVEEQGPPHDRVFAVSATVDGVAVSRGSGRSKKDAEQEAAQAALENLG